MTSEPPALGVVHVVMFLLAGDPRRYEMEVSVTESTTLDDIAAIVAIKCKRTAAEVEIRATASLGTGPRRVPGLPVDPDAEPIAEPWPVVTRPVQQARMPGLDTDMPEDQWPHELKPLRRLIGYMMDRRGRAKGRKEDAERAARDAQARGDQAELALHAARVATEDALIKEMTEKLERARKLRDELRHPPRLAAFAHGDTADT